MRLIMFDIDGTLTQTVHVDDSCFVRSLDEVFSICGVDPDWSDYPHCSDSGILEEIFQRRLGRSPHAEERSRFQSHFFTLLAGELAAQSSNPVPGASEMIAHLQGHAGYAVSLASGAWEKSARLKLASAGLRLDGLPGAFADVAPAREDIMRASFASAARVHGREHFDDVTYVGDGVWDARASRNLGYQFIGIARDDRKTERLYAEGASHVFQDYQQADIFLGALGATRENLA